MVCYFELFLLVLLFYLVIQLITKDKDKDKIVEGIGPIEEDPGTILIIDELDTGIPCTIADFDKKEEGEVDKHKCDTINGVVSGLKYNDDVSRCDCECGDGYRLGRAWQEEQGCIVSTDIKHFTCFAPCKLSPDQERGLDHDGVCGMLDSMKDGCGKQCTVDGGGTEQSDIALNRTIYESKNKHECTVSNDEFIDLISDLPKLITMSAILDLPGFTYSTFIQFSSREKVKQYTDESIMNQNHLKNQIIVKLDETCLEGVSSAECMGIKEKETRDIFDNLRDKTVLDFVNVDDFINVSFKLLVIELFGQLADKTKREGKSEETSQQIQHAFTVISEFVKLFEQKDKFEKDYQEHVGKILEEAKKSRDSKINTMSKNTTEEERRRKSSIANRRDISPFFHRMVSEELKTWMTIKGLLCRGGAGIDGGLDIDKIHLQRKFQRLVDEVKGDLEKDPDECNKQYCIGNTDITKDHVCPRLKYVVDPNKGRIEGNTDEECCEISFLENIWFKIQDLFN